MNGFQVEREAAIEVAIQQLRPQIEQEMLEKVLQNIGDEEVRACFRSILTATVTCCLLLHFAGMLASRPLSSPSFETEFAAISSKTEGSRAACKP